MHKLIRKLLGKLNIAFALVLAMLMVGVLTLLITGDTTNDVLAGNEATQVASTTAATTLSVVGKVADTAITTITFPEAAPSATVSVPYNDIDTVSDPQVLSATVSEPVVRLKNTSGGTYNVTLEITTWSNSIAASEDYDLVVTTDTTVAVVSNVLSATGGAANVDTYTQDSVPAITASGYMALYLEIVLGADAGKTGTSDLTILGETP